MNTTGLTLSEIVYVTSAYVSYESIKELDILTIKPWNVLILKSYLLAKY